MPTPTPSVTDTIEAITDVLTQDTLETRLLKPRLIRQLYKQLGKPTQDDFPGAYKHASSFRRADGYTTRLVPYRPTQMDAYNNMRVDYHIKQPSYMKRRIINDYYQDRWHVVVYAFNVLCSKFIRHPRYPQIAVYFHKTRDTATYEYVLVKDDKE